MDGTIRKNPDEFQETEAEEQSISLEVLGELNKK